MTSGNLISFISVMIGGAIGSGARYGLTNLFSESVARTGFPFSTLLINLTGCLFIGILYTFFENSGLNENVRLLLITGILGGFTTFSAFGLETMNLLQQGQLLRSVLYITLSVVGGIVLVFLGMRACGFILR